MNYLAAVMTGSSPISLPAHLTREIRVETMMRREEYRAEVLMQVGQLREAIAAGAYINVDRRHLLDLAQAM
jgi:hypothetical protein